MGKQDIKHEDPYQWSNIVGLNEKIFGKRPREHSKSENCKNGMHIKHGHGQDNPDRWKCENCDAVIFKRSPQF